MPVHLSLCFCWISSFSTTCVGKISLKTVIPHSVTVTNLHLPNTDKAQFLNEILSLVSKHKSGIGIPSQLIALAIAFNNDK